MRHNHTNQTTIRKQGNTTMGGKTMRVALISAALAVPLAPSLGAATPDDALCAQVTIQIEQQLVLTRQAFSATLTIDNATTELLEDIEVCLEITDADGQPANDLFFVPPPEVTGVVGPGLVTQFTGCTPDTFALGDGFPQAKTTARWDILAFDAAVPGPDTETFFIGGELRHELAGTPIVVPLFPVEVQVAPQPSLLLDYYLQSTVYSDDPFTFDIVEPAEPFNLGLRVRNVGFGDAKNLSIKTSEPELTSNEMGLAVVYQVLGAEIAGSAAKPALDKVAFGDLPGGESTVARWLMTSSLKGQFIDMDVTFQHVGGTGSSDLSLIDGIAIHDLFHAVEKNSPLVPSGLDDGLADFLVIDPTAPLATDPVTFASLPNRLDGSMGAVDTVRASYSVGGVEMDATVTKAPSPSDLMGRIEVLVSNTGWRYVRADAFDLSTYDLALVARTGPDGSRVSYDVGGSGDVVNAWTTTRSEDTTGGPAPDITQQLVHLLDNPSVPGLYVYDLTFTIKPQAALTSDIDVVSVSAGGTQVLTLDAGPANAGKDFIVLGSASGTLPGIEIGGVQIPLNQDTYFALLFGDADIQAKFGSVGVLDGLGQATVNIIVDPGAPEFLIGTKVDHAFVLFEPGGIAFFSSSPVPLFLQP